VFRLLPLLAAVALLLAACGGEDGDPSAEPRKPAPTVTVTATPTPTAPPTATQAPTPAAATTSRPTLPSKPFRRPPAPVDLSRYDNPGFTTPSGNIGCQFDDYAGAHVRCDRLQMTSVPGGKPADCEFDWGHSVELSAGDRGALACTSDSVMGQPGETDGTRALPYGDAVRYRGIVCRSTKQGLRCTTSGGHGFLLSRATIRVR
jgi:hypothetical protein